MNSTADLNKKGPQPAPPRAQQAQGQQAVPKRAFKVWYRPGPEDRSRTVWNGVTFNAGVPVTLSLDNPRHFVVIDMPKEVNMPDGTFVTRTMATKVHMTDQAKLNPYFEVEGFPRFTKKLVEGRRPHTADEYRSWAMAWIQGAGDRDEDNKHTTDIRTARHLLERWDDEEAMRERCGVTDDDVLYLKPFFDMKAAMLKQNISIEHARNDGGSELKSERTPGIEERYGTMDE